MPVDDQDNDPHNEERLIQSKKRIMRAADSVTADRVTPEQELWMFVIRRAMQDFRLALDDAHIENSLFFRARVKELVMWFTADDDDLGSFKFACSAAKISNKSANIIKNVVRKDAQVLGL